MAATTHDAPAPPPGRRTPQKSKATRWRAAVLIGIHLLIAIHVAHWLSTGSTVSPLEPSEAMEFAKYSVVNAGLIFFGLTILSTLILGRWFCGWACHVVALQDLSRSLLIKVGLRPRPLRSRWMALIPFLGGAYMFFWPAVYRLWTGDSFAVRAVEMSSSNLWETFTDSLPWALFIFFVAGFACVYFLGAKGFCTYACPYGALFYAADRVAPGRIRVTDDCVQCGHCTLSCTSNVDVSREVHDYGMVVDSGCMKCMDCVSVCPEDALYFGFGKPALGAKPRQEKRKGGPKKLPFVEEFTGLAAGLFAYFAWRGWRQEGDFLLSVGIAACFGYFAIVLVRLARRSEVKFPGVVLKSAGKLRGAGLAFGAVVLATAGLAVPFGITLELSAQRARDAEAVLSEAKLRWFNPGGAVLSDEERDAAETLLASAEVIGRRTSRPTLFNHMRIVWASLFLGKTERFDAALERALAVKHAGPDPRLLKAQSLLAAGDAAGARALYATVVEEFPSFTPAVESLARLQAESGDLDAADATIARGLEANPDAHTLMVLKALMDADRGQVDEGVTGLERALELHPEDHAVRDLARNVTKQFQRFDAAARILAAGVDLPGAPVEWRADLPQVLFVAGRSSEAADAARRLAELAAGDVRLLTVAAAVLEQTGHPDEAAAIRARMPEAR
ncbi:MAG: 4Fe-4S binding protein [Planctomycetota bacterium]